MAVMRTGGACRRERERIGARSLASAAAFLALVLSWGCSSGGSGGSVSPPPPPPSVTLSWVASTTSGVTYNVYRSAISGGPYETLAAASSTSYVDNSVASGQTYYYVVTAVDSQGYESAYSNEASATVP